MADLICVDPAQVGDFWPYARPLIKAAIDATQLCPFEPIEEAVLKGEQLLWLAWDGEIAAAATTALRPPVCELTACSGYHRERWLPLFAKIEGYAKAEGCKIMRLCGRKGWSRVLDGYQVSHVIMEKELS